MVKKEGDRILMFGYGYEGGWVDRFWMNALAEKELICIPKAMTRSILTANEEAVKRGQVVLRYGERNADLFSPINPSPAGWFGNDLAAGQLAMASTASGSAPWPRATKPGET